MSEPVAQQTDRAAPVDSPLEWQSVPDAIVANCPINSAELVTERHRRTRDVWSNSEVIDSRPYPFLQPARTSDELGWLAHYRVLQLLAQGGMGLVFLGEDPRLQRRLAIKVMKPELGANRVVRQRFLREARAAASIHSDHIIAIHDIGETDDVPFVVC